MMFVSINNNTTGVTCAAGTANPSVAPEFALGYHIARSLVFCIMFCRLLFFLLTSFLMLLYYMYLPFPCLFALLAVVA